MSVSGSVSGSSECGGSGSSECGVSVGASPAVVTKDEGR